MKFRWSIEELTNNDDYEMLRGIVAERMSVLNSMAPLYRRLIALHGKLERRELLTKAERNITPEPVVDEGDKKTVAAKLAKIRTTVLEIQAYSSIVSLISSKVEGVNEQALQGILALGYECYFGPNHVLRVKKRK